MRSYEIMFIARPDLDDAAMAALVDRAKGWVSAAEGEVTEVNTQHPWGRRRLAYPIQKLTEGQYVLMQAQMQPSKAIEVERNMRLNEQIIRFQILRNED